MPAEGFPLDFQRYIAALPKAELHVHLEGSIAPATLLELAGRNGVALPRRDEAGLREWFQFRDFDHFIEVYLAISRCLRRAEDYELAVARLAAELARQNARYAEVTFSPGTHERHMGVPRDAFLAGLARGRERARAEHGVELAWIFDIVRNAPDLRAEADCALEIALEARAIGVVALGLGGKEAGHPPEPFAPWFRRAREAGLRSAPHAGETAGPESVWGALRELGADRIGHGVRAIEDPELVRELARRRIPLEVNPTSNLRLGVYRSFAEHPLARLREAGVIVTVNTDDPPLFGATLEGEIAGLGLHFGFGPDAIEETILNAVRASFQPEERKRAMLAEFEAGMRTARAGEGG